MAMVMMTTMMMIMMMVMITFCDFYSIAFSNGQL